MKETKANLKNLTAYAVAWFEMLQEKYGKGIKRRTSYDEIEQIDASAVVSANQRLYVNRKDGFIGLNWRQHEFVTECTILDSVLAIMKDGTLKVSKVADKVFMGREIIHCRHLAEGRRHELLHDGLPGRRDRESLRQEIPDRRPVPRQALPPGEVGRLPRRLPAKSVPAEKDMPKTIHVSLDGRSGARVRELDFDLTRVPVSTRTSKGLTVTKWTVKEVTAGASPSPSGRR